MRKTLALLALALTAGCGGSHDNASARWWTAEQAESIGVVRGMPVRVRYCRGLGQSDDGKYSRFDCLASARAVHDRYPFETVAVVYVLHPFEEYTGTKSRHRLSRVKFFGGPGIP
jgi:hypothetical protein